MKNSRVGYSLDDDIETLDLHIRILHSLKRGNIFSIKDLLNVLSSKEIYEIPNLGNKSITEINEKLGQLQIIEKADGRCINNDDNFNYIIAPLKQIIRTQIEYSLLHERAKILGKTISQWLQIIDTLDFTEAYAILTVILGASLNLSQELDFLLRNIKPNYIKTLIHRHGYKRVTLEEAGIQLNVTRERIRQMDEMNSIRLNSLVKSILNTKSINFFKDKPSLLKLQSALLFADEMGLDITKKVWRDKIHDSGLMGMWSNSNNPDVDPIEVMIAICTLLSKYNYEELQLPENLTYVIRLTDTQDADFPARTQYNLIHLPKDLRREIRRNTKFAGAVNVKWLANETKYEYGYISDMLIALGYKLVTHDWYIPEAEEDIDDEDFQLDKNECLHHSLRKMFKYCGPLPIEEICGGLRHAISRTNFPVPPPSVMIIVLQNLNYKCENGSYYCDDSSTEGLSRGEELIFKCIEQNGKVVHHVELAQMFIASELSFPSLHATLNRSPLFDKFEQALYKKRGEKITTDDVARAENCADRIPVDLEVEYTRNGQIILKMTLGVLAVATGVILCEQLPNLKGDWVSIVSNDKCGTIVITEKEIRQLSQPIKILNCQIGNRLRFSFDMWDRIVKINIDGDQI